MSRTRSLSKLIGPSGSQAFDTNTLVIDAANNRVGIGTISPAEKLHVQGKMRLFDGGYPYLDIGISTSNYFRLIHDNPTDQFYIGKNSNKSLVIDGAHNVIINESGYDADFRVASDTKTHALFVEGSSGNVGIGTSSPTGIFSVTPPSNRTTLATSTTLTLNESTNNAAYQLRMAYSYLTSVYTGVIDAVQNSLGAPLAINPTGGKVGIGTTLPTANLEIAAGDPTLILNANTQVTNKKKVRLAASQFTAGDFSIQQINDSGTVALTAMTIINGGSVEIGTTTPNSYGKLAVYNATGDIEVACVTGSANYATYRLQNSNRRYSMQIRTDQANAWTVRDETSGSNQILVNTAGGVSMPNQPHSYGTFGSDNLSTDTGWTMSSLSTVALTYTNNASHGWGMTVEQAGYYQMTGMGLYAPSAGVSYVYIGWCVNGGITYHWHSNHGVESNHDFVSSAIRYCNVGDHITMENKNSRTLASQWGSTHSQYHIYKLG